MQTNRCTVHPTSILHNGQSAVVLVVPTRLCAHGGTGRARVGSWRLSAARRVPMGWRWRYSMACSRTS